MSLKTLKTLKKYSNMTNSKNIALYQLGLGSLKTYLLAAAFVISWQPLS